VETYAAVRRFVFVERKCRREASDRQDVAVFGTARLWAVQGSRPFDELRPLVPIIDAILEADKDGAAEATAYGEADYRTAADRTRVCRRLYDREGLCPPGAHRVARGLRAARPCRSISANASASSAACA
jgi:hypothetical protein